MQILDVYHQLPITPVKGQGAYIIDASGRRYLDFYGGHAVISIGHSHPRYVNAISSQVAQLGFYSNALNNPLQAKLADLLGQASGLPSYNLFLCNSGAEAVENALKVASFVSGRSKVLAFSGAFHGRTSLAVSCSDNPKIAASIHATDAVVRVPLNDLEALAKAFDQHDELAAVIVEGIQGVAGIIVPHREFLIELQAQCRRTGTMLVLDEIQSGYGRTGAFFAFQEAGVEPDVVCMAKGMGNGFPIGGILVHERFDVAKGKLGTTFGGNQLACAAGIAVLEEILDNDLVACAAASGHRLRNALEDLFGADKVRGRGLMLAVVDDDAAKLRQCLMAEHHVLTGGASDGSVMRLLPPLNITLAQEEQFIAACRSAKQGG